MALFRKFFFKKPPDGVLLITDNIYVFDHCFSLEALEEDRFEAHTRGIATHLLEDFHDHSFMVANFGTRTEESHIYRILSEYGMTVLDYPGHYEGCPLLTMEMVHCILKSSESWLSLGQHNLLIMHCEQGCWPILAFMLAALLLYLGHYSDEHKTLEMLYKQSSLQLLEMFSPLNPMPSQMRYLRYISMRNVMPEWPPADRALTLDCLILRMIPDFHSQGGFCPILRIYGPDPLMPHDQSPKVLFSTPKSSNLVRFNSQADELVKINLQCHVQGDVVLECSNMYEDLDREEMVFRIMFNTAFIRSNILMLNRDEIDMLWNAKDEFPKDFRAEVIFSDMDATTSLVTTEPVSHQEKQGLGIEEFAKVLDIFNHLDWVDVEMDIELDSPPKRVPAPSQGNIDAYPADDPETFFDTQEELSFDNLSGEINSSAHVLKLQNHFATLGSTELKQAPLHSSLKEVPSEPHTVAPSMVTIPKASASSIAQSSGTVIPQPVPSLGQPRRPTSDSAVQFSPDASDEKSSSQTPIEIEPSPLMLSGDNIASQKPSTTRLPPAPPGPPPKNFSNSLPSKGSVLSSAPPPPPTLSFGAKGRSTVRSRSPRSLRANQPSKRTPLKPLHWVKVSRATQGSLWADTQKSDEESRTPEIDLSELESLFSVSMPNTEAKRTRERPSVATKQEKVHLIDLQRSKNCEIMLRNIKMPLPDLMGSVLTLDDSSVDGDQVDYLIKFCPTKEEMELLKGYTGSSENLGKCEQFFLEMMKVPRVESKLRILSFKIKFLTQVADLKNSLNTINAVAEEVRNSVKLKRVMQTILSLGNALNQGTARGSAVGFRLDSLLKLIDIRARNNKMTLMHYLCKVLSGKLPEVLDFVKDLAHLEPASKIQLKELAEEMQAITKGLEKVEQELASSEKDGPGSETFYKKLKEFLADAQAEGRSLALLYSSAGKSADSLAHYFGEDPVRCPFEQVVSTLLSFVKTFERAHAENLRQAELEKKRAQMEAEREKAKAGGAHKQAGSPEPGVSDR
ncbi:hypothetical protein ACQ4PT_045847 [Festuca glaucescens]